MTTAKTNVVAKIAAVVAGLGLVAMTFAPAAKADTASDTAALIASLQAQIAALQAQMGGSTTTTTTTTTATFTMDLTIGSTGTEVTALQNWLIGKGFAISAGATGYFGAQTKAALASWQAANGVSPAAGYFGPITRAKVNGMGGTTGGTTTTTTTLQGGEGSLDSFSTLGDVESSIDEGDNDMKVLGLEFDANDADVMVERVDVDFTNPSTLSGSSDHLDRYVDSVSLWMDGKKLATMDVSKASEDDSDTFSFRFTGLKGTVKEDDTANLYVSVDAVSNLDGDDAGKTWDVKIPVDGIRAVDGAGISETYDSSAYTETVTFDEATSGQLDITEGDANPESAVVAVNEDDDTSGVLLMAFDVEADNQDITINDVPVGLVAVGADVDGAVKRVVLKADGKTVDTVSIPSTAGTSYEALFENLDLVVNDGDTVEFTVEADLNDADVTTFATGTTLYATTTGSNTAYDVEDEAGDSVTVGGSLSNSSNGVLTFRTEGIDVAWKSETAVTTADDTADTDYATFTMTVDVTAFEEDAYINTTGTTAFTYQLENASTGTALGTSTATTTVISTAGASVDGSSYKINAGSTETFTFTATLNPLAANEGASYRFQLLTVVFGSTNTGTGQSWSATPASAYETNGVLIND